MGEPSQLPAETGLVARDPVDDAALRRDDDAAGAASADQRLAADGGDFGGAVQDPAGEGGGEAVLRAEQIADPRGLRAGRGVRGVAPALSPAGRDEPRKIDDKKGTREKLIDAYMRYDKKGKNEKKCK